MRSAHRSRHWPASSGAGPRLRPVSITRQTLERWLELTTWPDGWCRRAPAALGGSTPADRVRVAVVVEVDKHVVDGRAPFPGPVSPPRQVGAGVGTGAQVMMIRAVHPHVDEICAGAQHSRQVRPAHWAVRGAVFFQRREDLLAMPAAVPELHRHPHPAGTSRRK